jgi:hypothetical protein
VTDRLFVVRTVSDDDGTWSVDVYLDQAPAEKRAQERLEYIVEMGKPGAQWTRSEDDDMVCWNPPDDWPGGSEVVIWKSWVDTRGPVKIDDDVWIVWIDWFDRETGVQMAYTTKEAARAAAEFTMKEMGGAFTAWDHVNDPDVGWNNLDDESGGIEKEVIIWERPVLGETDVEAS